MRRPVKRPTMKDVARAAGVSPMTVSRVVSGEPGVAPSTAARVEQAVRKLGYQRNDNARHLRQKNLGTSTIGLVVDDLANPFYALMARSVEDEAHRRGYVVLVGSTNDEPRREREVIAAFTARQVDGLILVPTNGGHGFLKQPMAAGTRVVCVDRPGKGLDVDTVTVDNRAGAQRAVTHLLGHGHTRIAYLGDRFDIWTQAERFSGYRDALAAHGVPVDEDLVRHGLRTRESAGAAIGSLRELPDPPTALFTSNDLITLGALDAADRTAPLALVGFDDLPLAERLDPPLTVVSQDPVALGGTAANVLFSRIGGDSSAPRSVVLLTRFLVRASGESGARAPGR
ncbi:transcriptional regulator, LacI family [Actinacidiphila yanglinensis]|uniref:Transcriptional regulator, LacI family n=1 Tax=Actinacidiphila yanglinensis TaxID=310779 RepID=A0A1H6B4Z9_9ACTN|nr:LacI family DNA-binding transcriptional regulator [Actinacidiphila yanglinensis]SEG55923.1 transcriptional regulator, LacI family [Actinacidiphila yanglinensis]